MYEELFEAYKKLINLSITLSKNVDVNYDCKNITAHQIEYLQIIDSDLSMTFSKLACLTQNSKPTITQTINRFIDMKCVYKERSEADRRVSYIRLTERGKKLARKEDIICTKFLNYTASKLSEEEMLQLIKLLNKL